MESTCSSGSVINWVDRIIEDKVPGFQQSRSGGVEEEAKENRSDRLEGNSNTREACGGAFKEGEAFFGSEVNLLLAEPKSKVLLFGSDDPN
jgi:hypothetical protein